MINITEKELETFANKLVDNSGIVIRKHFRNIDNIDCKEDKSPVTIADMEAETILRKIINETYPTHGIHGEEFGVENEHAEYKWIIDPIDGTLSFMTGRPIFGTLIGLLHNGKPILGVIDQPINSERWIAIKGGGTKFNGKKVNVRKCGGLENTVLATTSPAYYSEEGLQKLATLSKKTKHVIYGGDCYLYALLANGFIDLAVDSGLKPHDFLPIIPIIEEAGGIITDWHGNKLDSNSNGDVIITGDARTHAQAVAIMG